MKTKNASTQNQEKEILHDFAIWLNSDKGASLHWQSKDVSRIVTEYIKLKNKQQGQEPKMKTIKINTNQFKAIADNKLNKEQIKRLATIFIKLSPSSTLEVWQTLGRGEFATKNISRLHAIEGVAGHLGSALLTISEEEKKNKEINKTLVSLERQVGIIGQ